MQAVIFGSSNCRIEREFIIVKESGMRKVVLYLGMSLDGYIADKNGDVGWMEEEGTGSLEESSYPDFIETVDTVLMGYTTYHQIRTELSPDSWAYEGMQTYVFTHRSEQDEEEIHFTDELPEVFVRQLREQEGKDIWLCGGADLVKQFVEADLIDQYRITVLPVLLGDGIRLFGSESRQRKLKLTAAERYGGMAELIYEKQ